MLICFKIEFSDRKDEFLAAIIPVFKLIFQLYIFMEMWNSYTWF